MAYFAGFAAWGLIASAPAAAQIADPVSFDIAPVTGGSATATLPSPGAASPLLDASDVNMTSPDPIPQEVGGEQAPPPAEPAPAYGPPATEWSRPGVLNPQYRSFGTRFGAVAWETAGLVAFLTAVNLPDILDDSQSFRFKSEGLFGKDTNNIGVDKIAHSYNTYLLSEILYRRMIRSTGGGVESAVTAAILGSALQTYGEILDGLKEGGGFGYEDFAFNTAGAAFSALRNSVPGLREKLDFRIEIVPNDDIYTFQGKKHFEQQRFHLVVKLSGFEGINRSPLRFLELHAGYYAKDFELEDIAAGLEPKRKPFVGVSINFAELLFGRSPTGLGRAAATVLEYVQPPYTTLKANLGDD